MNKAKSILHLSPFMSGSIFYLTHWGAMGVVEPLLNVYLSQIGFTGQQIGLYASLFPFFTLIITPFIAALADRLNQRALFLQSFVFLTAGCALALGIAGQTTWLLFLLVFFALARSPLIPLADTEITQMAQESTQMAQ